MYGEIKRGDRIYILLCIFVPVVLASAFYYYFCPEVYFVEWIDGVLGVQRKAVGIEVKKHIVYQIIRFYLLDALWAFSTCNAFFIFVQNGKLVLLRSGLYSFLLALIIELMQGLGIVKGTFDVMDILVELVAVIIALTIIKWRKMF